MVGFAHATISLLDCIQHECLVIQVVMIKECALHLTLLETILINIGFTDPFIPFVIYQTKVHIFPWFIKYLHVLLYLSVDLERQFENFLGLHLAGYCGVDRVRVVAVLSEEIIRRREIGQLFGRLYATDWPGIETFLCLELLLVVKQHPHAVLIDICQLIVINLPKYLNLILIRFYESDKVRRVLPIKIRERLNKLLQLLQRHRQEVPEQELHTD